MEAVSVDLFQTAGKHNIIMVYRYSGFPFVHPLKQLNTNTITKCLTTWFMDWGIPTWLHSDGGPRFSSPLNSSARIGISCMNSHHLTTLDQTDMPKADVKNMKYLLEKHHAHWDTFKEALLEWQNTPRPDNLSPPQLMTGHHQHMMQPAHPAAYKHICTRPPPWEQADTKSRQNFSLSNKAFLQCPHSKRWDTTGKVISQHEQGQSYYVEANEGGT